MCKFRKEINMHRQQKISCKKVLYISHTPPHLTYPTLCCSDWVGGDAERGWLVVVRSSKLLVMVRQEEELQTTSSSGSG